MKNERKLEKLTTQSVEGRQRAVDLEALEIEHKKVQEELRKSGDRFQKIFDYSNDAILLIDTLHARIVDVNSRACEMLGYSREQLLSMPMSSIHPDEMPKLNAFANSVSRTGHGWTDELTCFTSTGQGLAAEISASLIDISDKSYMIALVRDISKRKRAEEALRAANARMKKDLVAAAKIQQSLLPKVSPDIPGVNFAWAFKPSEELAGDIFNVFRLDEKHVGLYLLDVSGHGVVASLLSVTLHHVLSPAPSHSLLKQHIEGTKFRVLPPAEVAKKLNDDFPMDPSTRQYFTLLYGILDLDTREFRYVSAGHAGLLYLSGTAMPKFVEAPGFPIGFFKQASYEEHSIRLKPGDRLYLYSDGITEARNDYDEEFGRGRLTDTLEQSRTELISIDELVGVREQAPTPRPAKSFKGGSSRLPFKESPSYLLRSVQEWCGGTRLEDDISILALEITQ